MRSSVKWFGAAALACLAALVLSPSALAQRPVNSPLFRVNPNVTPFQNPAFGVGAGFGAFGVAPRPFVNPLAGGLATPFPAAATLTSNPYLATPGLADPFTPATPYTPPYFSSYYDPFGGYFRGVADLTTAYGRYQIQFQQARLLAQQVEQAKIETRRKYWEWRWELESKLPTAGQVQQRARDAALERARKTAQLTDILSADALNELLEHLKKAHVKGLRNPRSIPLDQDLLSQINVAPPAGGNFGLLRNGPKLNWPGALRQGAFDKLRERFMQNLVKAYERAQVNGRVDQAVMDELKVDLKSMHEVLDKVITNIPPSQYMDAKRYLNYLDDTLRALQDRKVENYFNRVYEAKGKNVAELIDYLTARGLKFAPAVPGDEAAYRALHNFLVGYDEGLTQLAKKE